MFHTFKSAVKFFLKKDHPNFIDIFHEQFLIWSTNPRFLKLKWEPIADGPIERVEAARVLAGNKLYVIGGYHTLDKVVQWMDVFELSTGKWAQRIQLPSYIAQTHRGVDCEGNRYIYIITGQVGVQCSPCVTTGYVFDLETQQWSALPPLPQGRYAPMTHLWKGRLHVIAGSKEDRTTPAVDHWSLAVKDGKALEQQWREEPPVPRGGPHRCSAIIGDDLFAFGGQEGDRIPIAGDPYFTCDWKSADETVYGDSFVLKPGEKHWRRIADMPIPATHTEYAAVVLNQSIIILGGNIDKKMMARVIQLYDSLTNTWKIIGQLPMRNKGCVVAYYQGWLYVIAGQRQAGRVNPTYGKVLKSGWRARFSPGGNI